MQWIRKKSNLFFIFLVANIQSQEIRPNPVFEWKYKASVGLDSHVKFERKLPFGFRIGTDWQHVIILEGDRNLHLDQRPNIWFLTASHTFSIRKIDWENRLSYLNANFELKSGKFDSSLKKRFFLEERWALSPNIMFMEYVLDATAAGADGSTNRYLNSIRFGTKLGLDLEVFF